MPGAESEISVQLLRDRDNPWYILPLSVGLDLVLWMVPNPASRTAISRRVRDMLLGTPLLDDIGGNRYVLRYLAIEGQ